MEYFLLIKIFSKLFLFNKKNCTVFILKIMSWIVLNEK